MIIESDNTATDYMTGLAQSPGLVASPKELTAPTPLIGGEYLKIARLKLETGNLAAHPCERQMRQRVT